jgi:short-subunit dehydrogenase
MRLADATVLVTGASGGIGAAVARRLALRGARPLLHGRDVGRLESLAAELNTEWFGVDLAAPGGVISLVERVERVGPVDGLVHSAGLGWWGPLATMSGDEIDTLFAVNLHAPIKLTRLLLPGMIDRGRGHVSFLGSIAGLTGVPREAVYSASKAGLGTFADSLRLELAGTGVEVSVISPGAVATDFGSVEQYHRRAPRPIDAGTVADSVVRCISRGRAGEILPRWLAAAPAVRGLSPWTYRRLARRFG